MPRILLLTQHFPPEENAPAVRWSWLSDALVMHGFEVKVLTASWGNGGVEKPKPGLTIRRIKNTVPGRGIVKRLLNETIVASKTLFSIRGQDRPDVVIASAPPLTSLPLAHLLAARYHCPLVCDLRDAWPELLDNWREWNQDGIDPPKPHRPRQALLSSLFRLLSRWLQCLQRRAGLVVTTSERYATAVRERTGKEVICVRNIPVAAAASYPAPAPSGELRVLYLGNVGRAQHLSTAIRAAALAKESGTALTLRVVGDGAQVQACRRLAVRLNAPVEFHGRIPRTEVSDHYAWADTILVMLREWYPLTMTVPSKLYEALASGRHVSASVAGETADIIASTQAGDIVAPKDPVALARLWSDLAADRSRLIRPDAGEWLSANTDATLLADRYATALRALLEDAPR